MNERIDFSKLTRINEIAGDNAQDSSLLKNMANEAEAFLLSFDWCKQIKTGWFGCGVGGVYAVFLFEIIPATENVDSLLWTIVGDLPPAYLVIDESSTPSKALEAYIALMQEWVDAVQQGKSTDDLIPVNAPTNKEHAEQLEQRLNFIRKNFLQ